MGLSIFDTPIISQLLQRFLLVLELELVLVLELELELELDHGECLRSQGACFK
ncbi:MAG: hypothetical protein ACKVY0_20245 [Prosthecobacter sp.]|uniref:hypothetical protein n=1 Tax=Prosthecobacter sp. TaxID=1965333 RepID=UPI003903CAE5